MGESYVYMLYSLLPTSRISKICVPIAESCFFFGASGQLPKISFLYFKSSEYIIPVLNKKKSSFLSENNMYNLMFK